MTRNTHVFGVKKWNLPPSHRFSNGPEFLDFKTPPSCSVSTTTTPVPVVTVQSEVSMAAAIPNSCEPDGATGVYDMVALDDICRAMLSAMTSGVCEAVREGTGGEESSIVCGGPDKNFVGKVKDGGVRRRRLEEGGRVRDTIALATQSPWQHPSHFLQRRERKNRERNAVPVRPRRLQTSQKQLGVGYTVVIMASPNAAGGSSAATAAALVNSMPTPKDLAQSVRAKVIEEVKKSPQLVAQNVAVAEVSVAAVPTVDENVNIAADPSLALGLGTSTVGNIVAASQPEGKGGTGGGSATDSAALYLAAIAALGINPDVAVQTQQATDPSSAIAKAAAKQRGIVIKIKSARILQSTWIDGVGWNTTTLPYCVPASNRTTVDHTSLLQMLRIANRDWNSASLAAHYFAIILAELSGQNVQLIDMKGISQSSSWTDLQIGEFHNYRTNDWVFDFEPESWVVSPVGENQGLFDEYVDRRKSFRWLGRLGYFGWEGLALAPREYATDPSQLGRDPPRFPGYWRSWLESSGASDGLWTGLPEVGLLDNATAGFAKALCDQAGLYNKSVRYLATDAFHPGANVVRCNKRARFIPPQCQNRSGLGLNLTADFDSVNSFCREIYSPNPLYAEGVLENFIAAANLRVVLKWVGTCYSCLFAHLRTAMEAHHQKYVGLNLPLLFWAWGPEPGLVPLNAKPVAFDAHGEDNGDNPARCEASENYGKRFPGGSMAQSLSTNTSLTNVTTEAGTTGVQFLLPPAMGRVVCSQNSVKAFSKLLSNRVGTMNPTAARILEKFQITEARLTEMFSLHADGVGGAAAAATSSSTPSSSSSSEDPVTNSTSPHAIACQIIKNNLGEIISNLETLPAPVFCLAGEYIIGSSRSCVPTRPGYYQPLAGKMTEIPCPTGMFCQLGQCPECSPCPLGSYQNQTGQSECVAAPPGYFTPVRGTIDPTPCPAGTFSNASNTIVCDPCPRGTSQKRLAQLHCELCSPGTFGPDRGLEVCAQCGAGTYQPDSGRPDCLLCAKGSFKSGVGVGECVQCPVGMTTTGRGAVSKKACHCPSEQWMDDREVATVEVVNGVPVMIDAKCVPCVLGLICPAGSSWSNFGMANGEVAMAALLVPAGATPTIAMSVGVAPAGTRRALATANAPFGATAGPVLSASSPRGASVTPTTRMLSTTQKNNVTGAGFGVAPGFWMEAQTLPFEVKACHALYDKLLEVEGYETPCPGLTVQSCLSGRTGLACGRCQDDFFVSASGNAGCAKCEAGDWIPLLVSTFVFFAFSIGAYFFVNGAVSGKMAAPTVIGFSMGTFIGCLQVVAVLGSINVNWPNDMQWIFDFANVFVLDLRFLKPACLFGNSPIVLFAWKLLVVSSSVVTLFVSSYISRRVFSKTSKWHMDPGKTFNTFGTFYQSIFVGLSIRVIQPLRCFEHPDGTTSMMKQVGQQKSEKRIC